MIFLCSASKVRAFLLKKANIKFIQNSCEFDEDKISTKNPIEFVKLATTGKFNECLKCYGDEIPLLCADTVISDGKNLIRKPKNKQEAKKLLLLQSNSKIDIITYHILGYKHKRYDYLATTTYYFDKFDEIDLKNYLESNEWQGSAGGCKVEGFCKKYIKEVKGYESTAMGLCVEWVEDILKSLNV